MGRSCHAVEHDTQLKAEKMLDAPVAAEGSGAPAESFAASADGACAFAASTMSSSSSSTASCGGAESKSAAAAPPLASISCSKALHYLQILVVYLHHNTLSVKSIFICVLQTSFPTAQSCTKTMRGASLWLKLTNSFQPSYLRLTTSEQQCATKGLQLLERNTDSNKKEIVPGPS